MHLSMKQVGDRHRVHTAWVKTAGAAHLAFDLWYQLVLLKIILITNAAITPHNLQVDFITDVLIQLSALEYGDYSEGVAAFFRLDHLLHDITPLELNTTSLILPHHDYRLEDWDDRVARRNTGFMYSELCEIYSLFGLAQLGTGRGGCIPIPTGCHDSRGGVCRYLIHPEELFLFFMTRMYSGMDIIDAVDYIFGGYYNRWSYGWPWIVRYLDRRYENIIGYQGLLRFRDDIPRFYAAIERAVMRPKWHQNEDDGEWWWSPGLAALPYRIFCFVDCSIFRTSIPFSGPAGNYEGAPRKRRFRLTQRAFYTGFKSRHGFKVETLFLPNGLSFIFGPVSCRHPDIGGGASMQVRTALFAMHAMQFHTLSHSSDCLRI